MRAMSRAYLGLCWWRLTLLEASVFRARACLFAIPAAACAYYFVSRMLARISPLVDQISSGSMALDPVAIAAQLEQQGGSASMDIALSIMVFCWLASIADAWWCGRANAVA